ncbi:hypothetical protein GY45DRAFT_1368704 [Cubamyces sp. BRFM 1775]|nr:hypothetical protein GY45DRAFT_1368704 [Cubamyces sp. BRFM 1775]
MPPKRNTQGAKKTGGPGSKAADGEQTPVSRPLTPPESPRAMRREVPHINIDTGCGEGSSPGEHGSSSAATSSSGVQPDTHIDQLLRLSQQTLDSLGKTFGIVANQTLTLTTLGPALDAVKKIEELEAEVKSHEKEKNAAVEKAKADVHRDVEDRIENVLRPRVSAMVTAAVETVIADRVRDALEKQIKKEEKEAIERYRARILEVRILLTNAEARRSNEHCRHEFRVEPLRPLLRPPGVPRSAAAPANANANANGNRDPKGKKTAQQSAAADAAVGDGRADAGKPSALFPKDFVELSRMSARDARRLVLEYGLPVGDGKERLEDWEDLGEPQDAKGAGSSKAGKQNGNAGGSGGGGAQGEKKGGKAKEAQEKEKEREEKLVARERTRCEDLNAFMQFIGLGHYVVLPSSPRVAAGANGAAMAVLSPIVERSNACRPW